MTFNFDIAEGKTRNELADLYRTKSRTVGQLGEALGVIGFAVMTNNPTTYQQLVEKYPCIENWVKVHQSLMAEDYP